METEEKGEPSSLCGSPMQTNLDLVCREAYFCKFCGEFAKQPVLNIICGHLFCWCCLYRDVKRKRREGRRQCCPLCNSHLDIFGASSTIIRVCSGPQPGVVACCESVDEKYVERAKEAEKKLKIKGVPPRPWYNDACYYSSLSQFMHVVFIKLHSTDISDWCDSLCRKENDDPALFVELLKDEILNMIQAVENSRLWLKGEESSGISSTITKKENAMWRKKRIPSGKVKVMLRPHTKLRLSSQFFYRQIPSKNTRSKQQPSLHQVDNFADGLASFSCTICSKPAYEPVVIKPGHLFCWTCFRGQDRFSCIFCPATKIPVSAVLGDTPASSIYFTPKDYEEEDTLLAAHRPTKILHNQNSSVDITRLPNRPHPTMLAEFLEYMIFEIKDEGDGIIRLLDEVLPSWNEDRPKVDKICAEVKGRADALFAWLITAWLAKCKEQDTEVRFGLKSVISDIDKNVYYEMAWERLVRKMIRRIFAGGKGVDEILCQIMGFQSPGAKIVHEGC